MPESLFAIRRNSRQGVRSQNPSRPTKRRNQLETLEKRELLAAEVALIAGGAFAPHTSEDVREAFNERQRDFIEEQYGDAGEESRPEAIVSPQRARWESTALGLSLNEGDPAAITWGIVPDGTDILDTNFIAGNTQPSNLIGFLDGIYGDGGTTIVAQKPWFPLFEQMYDLWSEQTGLTFIYEPNDDQAPVSSTQAADRGIFGVRPDLRISGTALDGNFGLLGYNMFPNTDAFLGSPNNRLGGEEGIDGDMVIDTSDIFFALSSDGPLGENRGLINFLGHETGHGLGFAHSEPINDTKLLEPNISVAFFGPQEDDYHTAHTLYGDALESNDSRALPHSLGALQNELVQLTDLSIDANNDVDVIQFDSLLESEITITLQPTGTTYFVGPQFGIPVQQDRDQEADLGFRVVNELGQILIEVDDVGLGGSEVLTSFAIERGSHFIEVFGGGGDTQLYNLDIQFGRTFNFRTDDGLLRLMSVNPNEREIFDRNRLNLETVAPTELKLRFSGDSAIDPTTLDDGIRFRYAGEDGLNDTDDDIVITPGFLGFDIDDRVVIARFAEPLADGRYRVEVFGEDVPVSDGSPLLAADGTPFQPFDPNTDRDIYDFELELGAKVVAVVPQPVDLNDDGTISPRRNEIEVYFDDNDLFAGPNGTITLGDPNFYQLIRTNDSISPGDDLRYIPDTVTVEEFEDVNVGGSLETIRVNRVVLTFADDLANLAGDGAFRLKVGSSAPVRVAGDPDRIDFVDPGDDVTDVGNVTDNAFDLGNLASTSTFVVNGGIVNLGSAFDFPGGDGEPGTRDINEERHLAAGADATAEIDVRFFNFALDRPYGMLPDGTELFSTMNTTQMQRVREIYALLSDQLGVTFIESEDLGTTVVVGDLLVAGATSGIGDGTFGSYSADADLVVMDSAEVWYDGYGASPDITVSDSFFEATFHEIGHSIGLGSTFNLDQGTVMASLPAGGGNTLPTRITDFVYPGNHDVLHGQHLFRPDNEDVDFYSFVVPAGQSGNLTVETVAERLASGSLLDTHLMLYKRIDGQIVLLSSNDDSFGSDSFLSFPVDEGEYFVAVTGAGNENIDPELEGSGGGANTQGDYEVRIKFDAVSDTIVDAAGTPIDGDADGVPGGAFDFWFKAHDEDNTLYVDADASLGGTGRADSPIRNIDDALAIVQPNQTIRIVGNKGGDGDIGAPVNNFAGNNDNNAYEIGRIASLNQTLEDGRDLVVPAGVNVMIDAGVVIKSLNSRIAVGSNEGGVDASEGTLQVLGVPHLPVFFTSFNDPGAGLEQSTTGVPAAPGDWGGLDIRSAVDRADGRAFSEREGIFINAIMNADLRFGGGAVNINGSLETIAPIHLDTARPTIIGNSITEASSAAISADLASFEETRFTSSLYQRGNEFTTDYARIGPTIYGNTVTDNVINGLLVRVDTIAGAAKESLLVSARFDDTELVHVIGDDIFINGNPSGSRIQSQATEPLLTRLSAVATPAGEAGLPAGDFEYAVSFIDLHGTETHVSDPSRTVTVLDGESVFLEDLPSAPEEFVARRLYRRAVGDPTFLLVAELDRISPDFTDSAAAGTIEALTPANSFVFNTPDARLVIDPGLVLKMDGLRIETGMGADLIAEGTLGRPVVFTSRNDDRYGAGGTFDTNADGDSNGQTQDWAGIFATPTSRLSLDYAVIAFAGGRSSIDGTSSGFNAVQILQADARIANTVFEDVGPGVEGIDPTRAGRGPNEPAVIYSNGSEAIIVDNTFLRTVGVDTPAISVNISDLNGKIVDDTGRQTGEVQRRSTEGGNQGAFIRGNAIEATGFSGLQIRGGVLTTEAVWDDTDIVHVIAEDVIDGNRHNFGGLRLQSRVDESLVVKFVGNDTRLTATGGATDIIDRIGGTLHVIGQPDYPVILTSIDDDTVGAGFDPFGVALTDTDGNGPSTPTSGSWGGIQLLEFSNDRNVETITERESLVTLGNDLNATPETAYAIGLLAPNEKSGDETLRLGYNIHGAISTPTDVDIYSFRGIAGSEVWFDIDRTAFSLDSVIELIGADGTVFASSDNSIDNSGLTGIGLSMQQSVFAPLNSNGTYQDLYSLNPLDAGMRLTLPGTTGNEREYFVRVSGNQNSSGIYQLQIRLREQDEFAGSTVRHSEIRFAQTGIETRGLPFHSQLTGEASTDGATIDLGDISTTDRGSISVAGVLDNPGDVNRFTFSVSRQGIETGGNNGVSIGATFDVDFADTLGRPNTTVLLYNITGGNRTLVAVGGDSNILSDQASPLSGNDFTDLTRGSSGFQDPFLGTIELDAGQYEVAVINNAQMSDELQFQFGRNPLGSNSLSRITPVSSVQRIASQTFGPFAPVDAFAGDIAVPHSLGDIDLYVLRNDDNNTTQLQSINAQTGQSNGLYHNNNLSFGEIISRPDGLLLAYPGRQTGAETDANMSALAFVDPATGNLTVGNTGVQTFELGIANNAPAAVQAFNIQTDDNDGQGLVVTAIAELGDPVTGDSRMFVVASRGNFDFPGSGSFTSVTVDDMDNITGAVVRPVTNYVWEVDPDTGVFLNAQNIPGDRTGNARAQGAGTNRVEIGRIDDPVDNELVVGAAFVGNTFFMFSETGRMTSIAAGNLNTNPDPNEVAELASLPTTPVVPLDPNETIVSVTPAPRGLPGMDDVVMILTNTGKLIAFDPLLGGVVEVLDRGNTTFDNVVAGPRSLTFSLSRENLWHVTNQRSNEAGHGGGNSLYFGNANGTPNAGTFFTGGSAHGQVESGSIDLTEYSPDDVPMLYFSYFLETDGFEGLLNDPDAFARDSFRVFVSSEQNRSWTTVATNNGAQTGLFNDPGVPFANPRTFDEFDVGINGYREPGGRGYIARELHDNTGGWLQARIPLAPWAGHDDVRIRFEFNSAGESEQRVTEIRAVSPAVILDADAADRQFTIEHEVSGDSETFEFELGLVLQAPAGSSITDGDQITVNGNTWTFVEGAAGANEIGFTATMTATEVAVEIQAALGGVGIATITDPTHASRFQVAGFGLTSNNAALENFMILETPGTTPGTNPIPVLINSPVATVRDSMQVAIAGAFNQGTAPADLRPYQVFRDSVRMYGFTVTNGGLLSVFQNDANAGRSAGIYEENNEFQLPTAEQRELRRGDRARVNGGAGLFIDDVIIGFAERGETVTGANPGIGLVDNPNHEPSTGVMGEVIDQIDAGEFQLNIRLSADYEQATVQGVPTPLNRNYDTNDVIGQSVSLQFGSDLAPLSGADIIDGTTISISDSRRVLLFEFENVDVATSGVTPGNVAVPYTSDMTAGQLVASLRDAINQPFVQIDNEFRVFATSTDGTVSSETATRLHLQGPAAADLFGGTDFAPTLPQVQVIVYGTEFIGTNFDNMMPVAFGFDGGDSNLAREQGQVLLRNNFIFDTQGFGIDVDAGPRRADLPSPGSLQPFTSANPDDLAPGVVIFNNVIATDEGLGGIRIGGDLGTDSDAPNQYARVLNNTIVGGQDGIRILEDASPTLMNNAIALTNVGINATGSGIVEAFATLYLSNTIDVLPNTLGLGAFPVQPGVGDAVFVDIANRDFYPESFSLLIDNSVGAVDDRIVLQGLRNQLGIAISPIIAPSRDITDQLRTGAPNNNGGGTGNNVFIDIGAIDRSDTIGPIANLNVPLDNGFNDSDAAESFVRVIRGTVEGFEIQILDRNGVGLDDSTVTPESINVSQDGRLLVEGVDYQFSYAATNNTILIRPRTGIWDPNSAFEITLNNRDRTVFRAPNGLQVADEQRFTINDNDGNEVTFEYDSGFVLELSSSLALEVTATPDSILDRDTFQLTSSDATNTVTFEFEKIGGTDPANVAVDLTTAVTANDVRRAIFNALSTPAVRVALGISPRLEPTAQIHLGSQPGLTAAGLPTDVLLTGGVDPIQDGDTILYRSDDTVVQFEFDNDGSLQDPNSMRRISFGPRDTANELADKIAEAFALTPSLEVGGARALEGGRVYIGGDGNDDLSVNSVALTVRGRAGVAGKLELTIPPAATGATIDGERIEITSDGVNQGFLLTTNSAVVTADNIVLLDPAADADEIASVLADTIRTAFGGALDPTSVLNVVRLGEPDQVASGRPPIQTTVNVLASSITVSGFGGGTVPINFIPTIQFTEESMAGQIVAGVVDSGLNVSAFTPGGGLIYLDNVNLFIGEPLTMVGAIQDKAGNNLQPNRANRETQFTVLMPGVQLDFGDATPNFPTSLADNGARHTVGTTALPRLGTEIDSELDVSLPSDDVSIPLTSPVGTGGITATILADAVIVAFENAQDGDTLTLTIDGTPRTYELVLASDTPMAGNIPVLLVPDEPNSVTAERFATLITDDLLSFAPRANILYNRGNSGFMVQSRDDEDGALIGSLTVGANTIDGIFLNVDGAPLSFLNPDAPGGAELIVNTTGGGLLDAWVDFNGDGDFTDPGEQVLASRAVLDGENRLVIHSIPDPAILATTDATNTWLRLRLSSAGNATNDGVVIGGEVEDYEVLIARTLSPEPVDDSFEIFEDTPLVVGAAEAVGLNDQFNGVTDLMYEVENNTLNGALVFNETDGTFSYTPNPDFYGFDSFTYRISGTQIVAGLPLPVRSSTAGTVTIRVRAVNDSPVAIDHSFVTTEPTDTNTSTAVTVTSAQLLTGALPHEDANVLLPPWNELEQQLSVTQITVTATDGSDFDIVPVDLIPGTSNSELRLGDHVADAFIDDGTGGFVLIGTVTATVTAGLGIPGLANQVSQVVFQPADNYNEDNPNIGSASINAFRYTVSDDGSTTLPNGDPEDPQPAPESVIATVNIQVRPQNDPPTAIDDFIADVGGNPILEDTPVSIPVSVVLANDFAGQSSDDDESRGVNDGPVQLVTDFSSTTTVGIGLTNSGVALQPGLSGQGFLMHSQTNVFIRFSAAPPPASFLGVAAENMVAVRFNGADWQYSNGVIWTNFTPQTGDRLLASIDFGTNAITDLQFATGTFNGIDQGFVDSDLTFTPLFWNGAVHPTNFTVNGTGFTIVNDPAFPAAFRPFPIPTSVGGTVDFDPITDSLIYTPPADYYGFDTFEYFIQDEGVTTLVDGTVIDPDTKYASATVTLNISPVNDAPFATNHVLSETAPGSGILVDNSFRTLEDTSLTIVASDLLAGSLGHANPQIPFAPWDESIQDNPATRVVSLQFGGTLVDQTNAANVPFSTPFGTITNVTFAGDTFVSLEYLPNENFNADNPTNVASLDGQTRDFFNYTIEDSSIAELTTDQGGGLFPVTPMRTTAIAQVYVAPVNDAPVPGNDLVSGDPGGTWTQFFTNLGLPVPPVTEDTSVTIPAAFIIENDLSGPANATDETGGINDSPTVSINPITFTTTLGGTVTLNPLGDLEYAPPMDRFGVDTFEYEVLDQGLTEDLAGVLSNDPLTARGTISILLEPVNDPPITFDRLFTGTEDNTITFTADDLLGVGGAMPALPSNQLPPPPAPFDESSQTLRVVAFRDNDEFVDVNDLFDANTGMFSDGTLTMNTAAGGFIEFSFVAGAFVSGTYTPAQDYNGRTPFALNEVFQYVIADDGIEVIPGTSEIDGTMDDRIVDLPDQRSQPADVTLTVSHVNDAPEFTFENEINILERDDNGETTVLNFASEIRPGPLTALDELQRESVFFTLVDSESTVSPPNLFRLPPVFNSDGSLSLFPSPDLFGTSTLVVDVTDSDPNDPNFMPQTVRITMTANVQPVNDPPELDPSVLDTFSINPANPSDDAFDISTTGALTFVLPEDNTGAGGVTSSYEILATNPSYSPTQGGGVYERPGLLDLYIVGPDNEVGPFLAGSQVLNIDSFSATTMLGGTVEAVVDANNTITSLLYTPPADFNRDIGGLDSFNYTIADDSVVGGETYSLFSEALVDDPRTVNGRVLLDLRPVNDRPEFESNSLDIEIPEDSGRQSLSGFAFNIAAGPNATADDENDLITGQTFDFIVEPLSYASADVADFFVSAPRVTDAGTLIYETATDIFGAFEYEVTLIDNGDSDTARGDLNATEPVTLTINVLPVNDAPRLADGVSPLSFTVAEDNPLTLSADGSMTAGDLLGSYMPGAANEIPPGIGGGQTNMIVGFPTTTPQGGTLDPILDTNDDTIGYTYTPAPNFVGTDFLVYTITDNGQTVPVAGGGLPIDDFQSTEVTVPITVEARNDAPQFSLGNDVAVTEGDGPIEIINWMVGIMAGPADASDEIAGNGAQSLTLTLTEISNDINFTSAPSVVLGGDAATLLFEAEENAFGTAVYDAVLMDDGIHDPPNDQFGVTVHRFTITVAPVNDPPSFTPGGPVTVDEDSGDYSEPWATDISPGPGETDQTVTGFEVTVPIDSQSLFSVQPTISPTGVLSFTPAMDAAGQVDVEVVAVDSEGGRSDAVILSISIIDLNDPPVATDDQVDTDEETVLNLTVEDLLANDIDPDLLTNGNESLTLTLPTSFTTEQGAEVTFNPATGEIVYDPTVSAVMDAMTDNDTIIDRFTYTISDGEIEDTAEVTITVAGRNDAPRLVDDNLQVSAGQPTVLNILDNDIDVDGMVDATTIIITTQPSNGALEVQPNGTVIYEPLDGFTGIDQFRYTVADDTGQQSQQATVTLRIEFAPQTTTLMTGTFIDTPLDIDALAAVTSGDAVPESLTIVSGPENGTLELLGNAQLRYTPGSGFIGDDEIVFTVANAEGFISVPTTISISVVESTLENPVMAEDVNASGTVTPLDALLVINKLDTTQGSGSIPVLPTDKGPNYYDVSGNKNVSALDALLVINYMGAAANATEAEGESLGTTPLSAIIQLPTSRSTDALLDEPVSVEESTDKIVSFGSITPQVDPATLDLIATDDDDEEQDPTAIDDALTSLLD